MSETFDVEGVGAYQAHLVSVHDEALVEPLKAAQEHAADATHVITVRGHAEIRQDDVGIYSRDGKRYRVLHLYDPYAKPFLDHRQVTDRKRRKEMEALELRQRGLWLKLLVKEAPDGG